MVRSTSQQGWKDPGKNRNNSTPDTAMNRAWLTVVVSLTALARLCAADFQLATLPLGSAAPEFNLPGVDGRRYALKDFAEAKILVVVFTCNHCPTAQYYEERLKKLETDYKD